MIHIHNGDMVADAARRALLPGEHLPFRESLVSGPAPYGAEDDPKAVLEARAQFLATAHGQNLLRVRNDLLNQERALTSAMEQDEVVLWFEHDLFCLIHLLYLIDRFAGHSNVTVVWSREPLSQQEDLPSLFRSRAALTPGMVKAGRGAWRAYTSADPRKLNAIIRDTQPDFPFLREGLALHASRFPSLRNGLGVVEQRLLELIGAEGSDFVTLFNRFEREEGPRFGFGDSEVIRVLRVLAGRAVPLLIMTEEGGTPPKALLALTPAAANVLGGEVDYVAVNDPDYWLGGVRLTRDNVWRWDEKSAQVIPSPSAG